MKKLFLFLIALIFCFAITGCATMSNLTAVDTGTAVSSANFHYVKTVEGTATSTYIFGLFGGDNAGKAVADAKAKANLQKNQALTNVAAVSTTKVMFGVLIRITTTISADVVEFE